MKFKHKGLQNGHFCPIYRDHKEFVVYLFRRYSRALKIQKLGFIRLLSPNLQERLFYQLYESCLNLNHGGQKDWITIKIWST